MSKLENNINIEKEKLSTHTPIEIVAEEVASFRDALESNEFKDLNLGVKHMVNDVCEDNEETNYEKKEDTLEMIDKLSQIEKETDVKYEEVDIENIDVKKNVDISNDAQDSEYKKQDKSKIVQENQVSDEYQNKQEIQRQYQLQSDKEEDESDLYSIKNFHI